MHSVTHIAGTERFNIELSKRLVRKGHEVNLFIETCEPELPLDSRVKTHIMERILNRKKLDEMIQSLRSLFTYTLKWNPDVILTSDASILTRYVAAEFVKKTKTRIIPYIHNADSDVPQSNDRSIKLLRKIGRRIGSNAPFFTRPYLREFNVILCNSRFTESIVKKLDKNIDTRVIYPGVDYDLFSKDQVSNGEKYFFNQSWLTSQKNHMFLLQLAKKIDSKFLICGLFDFRMKKRKPMLDKMMNEKSDNVEFILNPAEGTTVKYLKNSYVYLSSSLNEGFGLSILEAMACGKPVIAMNSGGHNEVVGDSGILCASDISSWIEECKDLISNTSRYDELAERGKARAKEYNWERTTDNILSILES